MAFISIFSFQGYSQCPGPVSVECESTAVASAIAAVDATACVSVSGAYIVPPTTPVCSASPVSVTVRVIHDGNILCTPSTGVGFCDVIVNITGDATGPSYSEAAGSLNINEQCAADVTLVAPTATDNCGGTPTIAIFSDNTVAGSCVNNFVRTVVYRATDDCTNTSDFTVTITVNDNTPPVIAAAPIDITVECLSDLVAAGDLAWTDNCDAGGNVTGVDGPLVGGECGGTITRTWNISDICGNPAITQTQTITIDDNTIPTGSAPASVIIPSTESVCLSGAEAYVIANYPFVEANIVLGFSDNCSTLSASSIDLTATTASGDNCGWDVTYTFNVTDDCGNVLGDQIWVISGEDTQDPTWTTAANALDVTIQCNDATALTNAQAMIPVAADDCDTDVTNIVKTSGAFVANAAPCDESGSYTNTWTVTDACGNISATYTQVITVEDTTVPTWTTTAGTLNAVVECSDAAALTAAQALFPVATDNCDSDVTNIVKNAGAFVASVTCSQAGTITNTWTVTDDCGNVSAAFTQVITIQDTQAPTWSTIIGALNTTVDCDDAAALAAANLLFPLATDNCDADVTNIVKFPGALVPSVTCPQAGTITNTWTVTDECGNVSMNYEQVITVQDNDAPTWSTITGALNTTIQCSDAIGLTNAQALAPVATDNCDSDVTNISKTSGTFVASVTCPQAGTITNTWTVSDDCGNVSAMFTQVITIEDTQVPTWTTTAGTLDVTLECSDAVGIAAAQAASPIATDNCDADVTNVNKTSGAFVASSTCSQAGTYTNTWTVSDDCGNTSATFTQVITIQDTTNPTASNPAPLAVQCFPTPDPSVVIDEADNCTATPTVAFVGDVSNGNTCPEIITRTYSITDDCGNSITVTQTITINDDTLPIGSAPAAVNGVISSLANAVATVSGPTSPATNFDATMIAAGYSDNCTTIDASNITLTSTVASGNDCNWDVIYAYNVSDDCGNTLGSEIWVISGSDNTITPTNDPLPFLSVDCDEPVSAPTASSCTAPTIIGIPSSGAQVGVTNTYIFPIGTNTVTWTFDDGVGPTLTQTQTISVSDMTAPVVSSCPAGNIDIYLDSMGEAILTGTDYDNYLTALLANASDNCGGTLTTITSGQTIYTCADVGLNITLFVWVYDGVNFSSPCTITVNVIDNIGPTFENVPADIIAECDTLGLVPNADPAVVAKDSCGINGNVVFNELSLQLNDATLFGFYNYEIIRTWTATDVNGNQETATQTIFVQDSESPVFVNENGFGVDSVINISANQNNCEASLILEITDVDLMDNCTDFSNLSITNNAFDFVNGITIGDNMASASGVYPIGSTFVTFSASDPSGNFSSSYLVQVNVTDNTPPIASCTNNIAVSIPVDQDSIIIDASLIDNGSFDNCAGSNVELNVFPSVFYCSQIADGTQEEFDITLAVSVIGSTDTSFCQTTIVIQDNTAPVLTCIDPLIITLEEDGTATATTSMLNGGIDDCSDIMTIELTGNTAFDLTDIGSHPIIDGITPTLQVTDVHGNVSTCTPTTLIVTPPVTCLTSADLIDNGEVEIPYTSVNFTNVIGFQFSMQVDDETVATFAQDNAPNLCGGSTINVPNLSGVNQALICNGTFTNQISADGKVLSVSWFNTSPDPVSIADGMTLFNFRLDAIGVVGEMTTFSITGAPYANELTTKYGNDILEDTPALCVDPIGNLTVGDNATLPISGNVSTWSRTRIDTIGFDTISMMPLVTEPIFDTVTLIAGQGLANASLIKIETVLPLMLNTPDTTDTDMTDANGDYSVQVANLSGGVMIDLVPRKNNPNWLNNGDVNSSDLFFIQQHIVNNIPFSSIYDYVAADVNESGSITTLDLVLIQDVIVNPEISPVPSSVIDAYNPWRFIQREYAESVLDPFDLDPSIALPAQPMAPVVPSANRVYNPAVLPMADIDWIAVKVGQIFGSLNTSTLITIDVDSRTGENFVMSVENQKVNNGELISIPVYAKDYAAFIAWQFTLEFDENYLAYEGMIPGAIDGFEENKLGLNAVEEGIIGAVWYGNPNSVNADEVLFTLQFTALDDADALSGLIDVTSRTVTSQSSLMSGATGEVSLAFFSPTVTTVTDFELHQNRPNPFNEETLISFNLPEAGFARMTISDISGRTLKVVEGDFAKGYNEVRIQSNDLSSTGVLYYQLESAEHIATKKMIILN
ncbi:MAG: T9SS type A sorting domain-containing protein [Saprospiraceae bacterium]